MPQEVVYTTNMCTDGPEDLLCKQTYTRVISWSLGFTIFGSLFYLPTQWLLALSYCYGQKKVDM